MKTDTHGIEDIMTRIGRRRTRKPPRVLAMQLWEHKVCALSDEDYIDQLGAEGWEAVGLSSIADDDCLVLLKRPRPPEPT